MFFIFRIFKIVADINSGTIFWLLPLNAIFMAISLYNVEHVRILILTLTIMWKICKQLHFNWCLSSKSDFDVFSIAYNLFCLMCSLIWPAIFSYFATVTTIRLSSLANTTFETNWYDYPAHLRNFLILVIARSQEPAYFTGFKFIRCTLEIFGKVRWPLLHILQWYF